MELDSTSLFRTTEEYFVREREFRIYIEDVVNPARRRVGLSEINDHDAQTCFRILDKFFAEWRSL